jgi:hypothetical protein
MVAESPTFGLEIRPAAATTLSPTPPAVFCPGHSIPANHCEGANLKLQFAIVTGVLLTAPDLVFSQNNPSAQEIDRRIGVVRQVVTAGEAEGGYRGPGGRDPDALADTARWLDAMTKANAGDIPGAVAIARQTADGSNGDLTIQRLAQFRSVIGDRDGAMRLAASITRPDIASPTYEIIAAAAIDDGGIAGAQAARAARNLKGPNPYAPRGVNPPATPEAVRAQALMNIRNRVQPLKVAQSHEGLAAEQRQLEALLAQTPDTDVDSLLQAGSLLVDTGGRPAAAGVVDRINKQHPKLTDPQQFQLIVLTAGTGLPVDDAALDWVKSQRPRLGGVHNSVAIQVARAAAEAGNQKDAARFAATLVPVADAADNITDQAGLSEIVQFVAPADPASALKIFDRIIELANRMADGRDPIQHPGTPEADKSSRTVYGDMLLDSIVMVATAESKAGLKDESRKRLTEAEDDARKKIQEGARRITPDSIVGRAMADAGDTRLEWGDTDAALADYRAVLALPAAPGTNYAGVPFSSDTLLTKIATIQVQRHQMADAVATVGQLPPPSRPYAAGTVADAAIKAGDIATAESLTDSLADPEKQSLSIPLVKPQLLVAIARAKLAANDKAAAAKDAGRAVAMLDGCRDDGANLFVMAGQPRFQANLVLRPTPTSVLEEAVAVLADAAGDPEVLEAVHVSHAVAVHVLARRHQFELAHRMIDKPAEIPVPARPAWPGNPGRPAQPAHVESVPPKLDIWTARMLTDVAVAELEAGDRPAFDRDARLAAEMAHEPDQPGTVEVTSWLAAALEKAHDPAAAEKLRADAVRRVLTGSFGEQGIRSAEGAVTNDALGFRGTGSAFTLAEAAPTPALRARLLWALANGLRARLDWGQDVQSFVPVKPAAPPAGPPDSYKGLTMQQWADRLATDDGMDQHEKDDALIRFGPAVGPVLAKLVADNPNNDHLGELALGVIVEANADKKLVLDLTSAPGYRTSTNAQGVVKRWGFDGATVLIDWIEKSNDADRVRFLKMLGQGVSTHPDTAPVLPGVEYESPVAYGGKCRVLGGAQSLDPAETKKLISLMPATNQPGRSYAIRALAGYGDASAVPVLTDLLTDPDVSVRNMAILGLARLGTDAKPALNTLKAIPTGDRVAPRAAWAIRRIEGTEKGPE